MQPIPLQLTATQVKMNPAAGTEGILIYLVRHGETEWNRTHRFQGRSDIPLNAKGREQVAKTALALKDVPFSAIYASPLARAVETATQIQAYHANVPLTEVDGFVEMELGDFDGMEAQRWMTDYADFMKAWRDNPGSVRMPGLNGECLSEVQTRAMAALDKITQANHAGSTFVVCSHNFVILSILCKAQGISLDHFRKLRQDTAAYSIVRWHENRYTVQAMNRRSHLADRKAAQI
jgi:broad specificity phosphatase PhoE